MWDPVAGVSPEDRLTSASPIPPPQDSPPTEEDAAHRCSCIADRLGNASASSPASTSTPTDSSAGSAEAPNYGSWSCGDDPPPYASLINNEHHKVPWSYVYPGVPYEDSGGTSSGGDNRTIARPLVAIPLTSYGIFKIEPPRYTAVANPVVQLQHHPRLLAEVGPPVKSSSGTARKYGAILIAATVIIFLMALSLMVRFVTEKSLWRG